MLPDSAKSGSKRKQINVSKLDGLQLDETQEHLSVLLTPACLQRVREGLVAACDRNVRQSIQTAFDRIQVLMEGPTAAELAKAVPTLESQTTESLQQNRETQPSLQKIVASGSLRRFVMRVLIRSLFRVKVEFPENRPQSAALLAANHLNHLDPFLLLAEIAPNPYCYILGDARTLYNKSWKRWILGWAGGVIPLERRWKEETAVIAAAQAGQTELAELAAAIEENVPTGTDIQTLRQIDRTIQAIFARGDSIILFPEGRLGSAEAQLHLPLKRGTAIYALRAGVPIVPVALIGTQDLYLRKQLTLRFGEPLHFPPTQRPKRQEIEAIMEKLQCAIAALLPDDYQDPKGIKLLRYFLNHMFW